MSSGAGRRNAFALSEDASQATQHDESTNRASPIRRHVSAREDVGTIRIHEFVLGVPRMDRSTVVSGKPPRAGSFGSSSSKARSSAKPRHEHVASGARRAVSLGDFVRRKGAE